MGRLSKGLATLASAAILIAGVNYAFAHRHMQAATNADARNEGIKALAYHQWLINPNALVVDIWGVDGERSMLDVTRVLLSFASQTDGRSLDRVILAHRGSAKFYLDGDYFARLGREYGNQNPVYTLRTLPQNVKRMDGRPAFATWTGGWLGVTGKQMEDLNAFHRQWWVDDAAKRSL